MCLPVLSSSYAGANQVPTAQESILVEDPDDDGDGASFEPPLFASLEQATTGTTRTSNAHANTFLESDSSWCALSKRQTTRGRPVIPRDRVGGDVISSPL
jgi:hypothetical protein